ncbi:alcohol dehydrogenase [Mycena crocata]|nr:alcohol dehydrogenase [Mycena crocata]
MASSLIPESHQVFRRTAGTLPLTIEQSTEKVPTFGPDEVLIRIHAVSLNFRDIAMLDGRYPAAAQERGIPASDCAAEVIAVGAAAANEFGFAIGERVAPTFTLNNLTGKENLLKVGIRALGGDAPGVLCEYAVFEGKHLVRLPKNGLSWEEASTITCAGVTAWTALNMPTTANLGNKTALLQGTGGVSMFALLICLAAGIHPIITSSSDAKLADISKLAPEGKISTINYKTHPDWAAEAKRLTGDDGADIVIDNIGPSALTQDVEALAFRGAIALVGFLGGLDAPLSPMALRGLKGKIATIRGIAVGSKLDFQDLNNFLETKNVKLAPLVDKVFAFNESKAAFEYLKSGKAVGKVVIKF